MGFSLGNLLHVGSGTSVIKSLLGNRFATDVQSVEDVSQTYEDLRAANDPAADALAQQIADAQNAYLLTPKRAKGLNTTDAAILLLLNQLDITNGPRQDVLAARVKGQAWLNSHTK